MVAPEKNPDVASRLAVSTWLLETASVCCMNGVWVVGQRMDEYGCADRSSCIMLCVSENSVFCVPLLNMYCAIRLLMFNEEDKW